MTRHFDRHLDKIKAMVDVQGKAVEAALEQAVAAVSRCDLQLAEQVIASDRAVNDREIEIEEECLHSLALYQPVASDLRYLTSVMKINNDLERIGDLAANIAEQTRFLTESPDSFNHLQVDLTAEAECASSMVRTGLEAMLRASATLAQDVIVQDNKIDDLHRQMYHKIESAIRDQPDRLESLISLLNISRLLERIADHAVNIAMDVIYMTRGEIWRHSRHTT